MPPRPSAEAVIELLGLEPHPTCGYVTETYRSPDRIAPGGMGPPFADGRPLGTDVEAGDADRLAAEFPAAAALLDEFLGQ